MRSSIFNKWRIILLDVAIGDILSSCYSWQAINREQEHIFFRGNDLETQHRLSQHGLK